MTEHTTIEPFDHSKYVLGNPCIKQHDYSGTGKTLRFRNGRTCVECSRENNRKGTGKAKKQYKYCQSCFDVENKPGCKYCDMCSADMRRNERVYCEHYLTLPEAKRLEPFEDDNEIEYYYCQPCFNKAIEAEQEQENRQRAKDWWSTS